MSKSANLFIWPPQTEEQPKLEEPYQRRKRRKTRVRRPSDQRWGLPSRIFPAPRRQLIQTTPRQGATEVQTSEPIDWIANSLVIVDRLRSSSGENQVAAVLFAETTAFSESELCVVLPLLLSFIRMHRFSAEEKIVTATGSAVRKYAMNASEADLVELARCLAPSDTLALPLEFELEVCKALLWRFTDHPPSAAIVDSEIAERAASLAADYLAPRVFLQKCYAAIVLNSALLAMLTSTTAGSDLAGRIVRTPVWFQSQFNRRREQLIRELGSKSDPASVSAIERLRV